MDGARMGKQIRWSAAGRRRKSTITSAQGPSRRKRASHRAGDIVARTDESTCGFAGGLRGAASRDARTGDRGSGSEDRCARRQLVRVATTLRTASDAPAVETTAAVGELFEREAVGDQVALDLGLALRAGNAVLEFVRRLRVAGAVNQQTGVPLGRRRANHAHRLPSTDEQPDGLNKSGHEFARSRRACREVYPT